MKDELILQLEEIEEEEQLDELIECQIEDSKIKKFEENIVLLQNLLKEALTEEQLDIVCCLVENEIKSDTDYLDDIEGEEKEYFKTHITKLNEILNILK